MRLLYDLNKPSLAKSADLIRNLAENLHVDQEVIRGMLEGRRKIDFDLITSLANYLGVEESAVKEWALHYEEETTNVINDMKAKSLFPMASLINKDINAAFALLTNDIWQLIVLKHNHIISSMDCAEDITAYWKRKLIKNTTSTRIQESRNNGSIDAFPFTYLVNNHTYSCWVELFEHNIVILEALDSDRSMIMPELALPQLVEQILYPKGLIGSPIIRKAGRSFPNFTFLMRTWTGLYHPSKPEYRELRIMNGTLDIETLQQPSDTLDTWFGGTES